MSKQLEFSTVHWHEVAEVGFPPRELRSFTVEGRSHPRVFLCRVGFAVCLRIVTGDDDGFMDENDICQGEKIEAWAVFDCF